VKELIKLATKCLLIARVKQKHNDVRTPVSTVVCKECELSFNGSFSTA
jgi:hypothetical protein